MRRLLTDRNHARRLALIRRQISDVSEHLTRINVRHYSFYRSQFTMIPRAFRRNSVLGQNGNRNGSINVQSSKQTTR